MQRDPTAFTGNPSLAHEYDPDGCMAKGPMGSPCVYGVPVSPAFGVPVEVTNPQPRSPLGGFEFQPSKSCPRNFIIFDQTDDKGRVMYHPALIHKLNPINFNVLSSHAEHICKSSSKDNGKLDEESSFKEDTREIDALLSSDEEEGDGEDDTVSTGRTPGHFQGVALDSSSSFTSERSSSACAKGSTLHASMEDISHERMRKMVTVLRGIIPSGDQLDTPAVIEEAVRYLQYLKMEAKKLGVESFDD